MRSLVLAVFVASAAASAQVVSNDGSLSYMHSFPLPPARGRYQPVLALNYNSNAGATAYGVGWSLTENYIDATTRATPTTSGTARTRYSLVVNGASRLLVPSGVTNDNTFRADVSQAYFAVTPSGSLPLPSSWAAVDSVGNAYTYGCVGASSCDRWYLQSVADRDGNTTHYDYNIVETHACPSAVSSTTALLTGIWYDFGVGSGSSTPIHQVTLTYSASTSPETQAIDGCLVTHDRLLTGVAINRAATTTTSVSLGSWVLSYSVSRDTSRERLNSIQAYDRAAPANPLGIPTAFTYEIDLSTSNTIPAFDASVGITFDPNSPSSLSNPTQSQCLAWTGSAYFGPTPCQISDLAAFIDIDGDGLPDMVWGGPDTASSGANPGLRWARNLSTGQGVPTFSTINILPGSTGFAGTVTAMNVDGSFVATGTNGTQSYGTTGEWGAAQTLLLDVNGDGAPDLLLTDSGCASTGGIAVQFSQYDSSAPNNRSFGSKQCLTASAPLSMFTSIYGSNVNAGLLPVVYTEQGSRPVIGASPPTYTWAHIVDFTGDGILDYVIADKSRNLWYVYPGYKSSVGMLAFSSSYLTVHPTQAADNTSTFPIRQTYGQLPGATFDGSVSVDFRDINGDGLPDRIVYRTYSTSTANHNSWYVEYNTGADFISVQDGSLPQLGMYQLDAPSAYTQGAGGEDETGFVSGPDTAMVDLNRDGRPEYITRLGSCSTGSTVETFALSYNTGSGFVSLGTSLANPTGYVSFRPYGHYNMANCQSTFVSANEGLYDLDGDGIPDYVRGRVYPENSPNMWSFYKGHFQSRRSDIMTKVIASSGLSVTIQWVPSSTFDVAAGLPYISDMVSSMTQSGPAMDPLTTSYTYQTPQVTVAWDDPTGWQQEPLGFAQRFDTPSIGGLTRQTMFGSTHATAGLPLVVCVGTSSAPCSASTAPDITDQTRSFWGTTTIKSGACSGECYPLYLYLSLEYQYRTELGSAAVSSWAVTSTPDSYGNIHSFRKTGDTLSSGATSVNVTRTFATGSGSACVSCIVEEIVADPTTGVDLAHTYSHYDLPSGSTSNSRDQSTVALGHLSYVEALVSGTGPSGQYEVLQIVYYGSNGAVSSFVRSYQGQQIATLTETIAHDPFNGYDITSRTLSDGAVTQTINYQWNWYGDLLEVDGPTISGLSVPTQVFAKAYDTAGRVIAQSAQPMSSATTTANSGRTTGLVNSPLRAFEYITATATSPAAVKTYTFAAQTPTFTSGSIPQTDDSTQQIRYVDALGRVVQVRTRLSSGTAPGSAAGNVVKSLSAAQYSVTSNVWFDGLGRVIASLEPYFSSSGNYIDLRASNELSTPGLHATTVAYDSQSRPICSMYAPVSGSIVAAPTNPSLCSSTYLEGSTYQRATRMAYGVDGSFDNRLYMTADTIASWASYSSNPSRFYLDSLGRVRYTQTPAGLYEQTQYDQLGRRTSVVRYPGAPPASPTGDEFVVIRQAQSRILGIRGRERLPGLHLFADR